MSNLDLLVPKEFQRDTLLWATVTQASPLRVRLDGESDSLPFAPDTLVSGLILGDRVLVALIINSDPERLARRVIVVGRNNGRVILCEENVQNTSGTTTMTSDYTSSLTGAGATTCSQVFTAPKSGKVLVHNNCALSNSGANDSFCSFLVRAGDTIGAGTVHLFALDSHAIRHNGTATARKGVTKLVTGLTPGAQYIAYQAFKVSAGTGTFQNKNLIVEGK